MKKYIFIILATVPFVSFCLSSTSQPVCSATIITNNTILCNGDCTGSLTAVANGVPPFHFLWSTNDTTATVNNLCAGLYTVVMTDSVGCIDSTTIVVTEPPPLTAVYTTIYGCSTCTTFATINGGTPPYAYQWCDGSIGPQLFLCGPGICLVYVVDGNGCTITDTINLSPPPALFLNVTATGTTCAGCSDGTITGTAAGGIAPYIYLLTPPGITNSSGIFTGLPAGNYQVCVTDTNNCIVCNFIPVADDPTGIIYSTKDEMSRVYPNPFTDETTLEVGPELLLLNPDFIILDLLGNELSTLPIHQLQTIIDRKNLSSGVYFYRLRIEGKTIANGKLIIAD